MKMRLPLDHNKAAMTINNTFFYFYYYFFRTRAGL